MNTAPAPSSPLPRNLKDFILYYWRFDPKQWKIFLLQDAIHFSRYPIAYLLVGNCVDILTNADRSAGIPAMCWVLAAALCAVLFIGESMHIWTAFTIRKWKPRLRVKIRSDFFNYMLGHSHNYFQNNFAGALARKVTEIAESSVRLHDHVRFAIFGSLTQMISCAIALFLVSPWYGLVVLIFITTIIVPVALRLERIGMRSRAYSEVRAYVTGTVVDILTNASSMRNFSRQDYEISVHGADSEREQKADSKRILTLIQMDNYRRLSFVVIGTLMMVILLLGWHSGYVSIGEVGAVMGLTFSLTGSSWMLGGGIIMTADELSYIDDAIRMVTPPHEIRDEPTSQSLVATKAQIDFKHIYFNFGARDIFRDLNLTIEPGQKVGLLGPSGAGKSTLINILLRLYEIDGGDILIDGQNIQHITQESLRSQIALIPQDTALFHRSLRDNIRYGSLEASEAEIIEAAKKAHAHDFISELPEGYDTQVGERGIKLSGGQRQRIAIARAILKSAPILILDEATSALDSESEKLIQDSLKTLMQGKTVIAIAHRLSTIAHLDRLIVMESGQVIEDGSHQQLIDRKGLYARLWDMQSGGFIGFDHPAV